jgi:hypothetical protein
MRRITREEHEQRSTEQAEFGLSEYEFSPEEWEEIKAQALAILKANSLDTPEHHLAYVREQLSLARR